MLVITRGQYQKGVPYENIGDLHMAIAPEPPRLQAAVAARCPQFQEMGPTWVTESW